MDNGLDTTLVEYSSSDKKRGICIPTILNEELAEEIGIHLGDGSMNIYKGGYLYSVEGHLIDDRQHYVQRIGPLMKKLYNADVRLRERKCAGVYGFQFGSKAIGTFKSRVLGLPLGPKRSPIVPDQIRSNPDLAAAFLRGYFDTDGCVYLEKKYGKLYPRLFIVTASQAMYEQLTELFQMLDFNFSAYQEKSGYFRIETRGFKSLNQWRSVVGSNNPKHLAKIKKVRAQGDLNPRHLD